MKSVRNSSPLNIFDTLSYSSYLNYDTKKNCVLIEIGKDIMRRKTDEI